MNNVKIYEIKSSAVNNYHKLLSGDGKYFYWDNKVFKSMSVGEYVFVVNSHSGEVLFTEIDKMNIKTKFNSDNKTTHFEDLGNSYESIENNNSVYENFVRFKIISKEKFSDGWNWLSLGTPESTWIMGDKINKAQGVISNNIERVEVLLDIFKSGNAKGILLSCIEYLRKYETSVDFFAYILRFIRQGISKEDLKTRDYLKKYRGCAVRVSFGAGTPTRVPWMAFLKDNNQVSKGIYPVFLYYKEKDILILSYGVSETNQPDTKWDFETAPQTISSYFENNYNQTPFRYGGSFVYKAYNVNELNRNVVINDLNSIIDIYLNQKNNKNKTSIVPKNKLIKLLSSKKQIILYGPPGTGKTYNTKKISIDLLKYDQ